MMPHQMQSLFPLMRKMVKVKTVIMVDTNDEDEFSKSANITSIPTLWLIKQSYVL